MLPFVTAAREHHNIRYFKTECFQEVAHERGFAKARRGAVARLLAQHDLNGRTIKRKLTGQCLVKHDTRGIDVCGWPHRCARGLLRCHGGDSADRMPDRGAVVAAKTSRKPKVKENEPSLGSYKHIRGFDVAVDLPGGMEGRKPCGKLLKGGTQTLLVKLGGGSQRSLGPWAASLFGLTRQRHAVRLGMRPRCSGCPSVSLRGSQGFLAGRNRRGAAGACCRQGCLDLAGCP